MSESIYKAGVILMEISITKVAVLRIIMEIHKKLMRINVKPVAIRIKCIANCRFACYKP